MNSFKEIVYVMVQQLAQNDYKALCKKIEGMTYEDAFKALDGYNLSAEPVTCNNELIGISEFFYFSFGFLTGTIFRTKNNKCELHEIFDFWVDDMDVARLEINKDGQINETDVWYFVDEI